MYIREASCGSEVTIFRIVSGVAKAPNTAGGFLARGAVQSYRIIMFIVGYF